LTGQIFKETTGGSRPHDEKGYILPVPEQVTMALAAGSRLGPYEIQAAIGAGGMGEVYKAVDTRLSRTVALKVLPPHFADDPDMKQRFEREAQTIAGLNHPNICTLHDVGEQDGTRFLVMEYVEGETLADRLTHGPLPIDEALRVAGEIIDALDRAHRQDVVHRDLKPANVMLARDGGARSGATKIARTGSIHTKLLDFGLAKWATSDQAKSIAAQPTRLDVTAQGAILGTLQYMAPEQVEGRAADARTDIFAFGAVLYEMLTGKKAFEGKSQASLIGAIMKAEPRPISHLQPLTPAVLDHVVARCLEKDPDERWQDAHSVKLKLQWIARTRSAATTSAEATRRRWPDLAVTAAIAVLLAAVSVPAYLYWRGAAEPEAIQFRHTISGLSERDFALSPDGQMIAFVAKPDSAGGASLYIRPVRALTAVKLAGTDNATQPFWSPDSRFIGYVGGGKLRKVAASGGAPQDVCDAREVSGAAWSATQGGTIIFGSSKGLFAVSAEGGQAAPVSELAQGETGHFWPSVLPDGRHLVYLVWSEDPAKRAIQAGSLDSKDRTTLIAAESNAVYAASGAGSRRAAPGYLFFTRKNTLFAQPFNPGNQRFTGDPVQVAGEVSSSTNGHGNFAVSQTGVLLYFQGSNAATGGRAGATPSQFNWSAEKGGSGSIAVEAGSYGDMDLSPDGRLVAITKQDGGAATADIWVIDWAKGVSHKVTTGTGDSINPVWSPDGARIAFTSYRKGNADIYLKNANAVGDEIPILESASNESVEDWSRDGKYIAFMFGRDAFQDIHALPFENGKPGKPFPVVEGPYQKNEPQFSKDGKWLAYTSDENEPGKFQVYVTSFPAPNLKQQISTDGGGQPRWSWDGKKVYYRSAANRLMAVDMTLGAKIESSIPRAMAAVLAGNPSAADPTRHMWSVAQDGRFLVRVPPGGGGRGGIGLAAQITPVGVSGAASTRSPTTSGLTALLNWTSTLPRTR
jgi:eukaryotic-like serine/threonine-protein kinase